MEVEEDLLIWLTTASALKYDIVLAGDFNVNLMCDKNRANRIKEMCAKYGLSIGLDGTLPTHSKGGALDNVCYTTFGVKNVSTGIIRRGIPIVSDHEPVFVGYSHDHKFIGDTVDYYRYTDHDMNPIGKLVESKLLASEQELSLKLLQEWLVSAVRENLVKTNSSGGCRRNHGWESDYSKKLLDRMDNLRHAKVSIKKNCNTVYFGCFKTEIKRECELNGIRFSDNNVGQIVFSARLAWQELQQKLTKEIQQMKIENATTLDMKLRRSAKAAWKISKVGGVAAIISKLNVNGTTTAIPHEVVQHIVERFTTRYSAPKDSLNIPADAQECVKELAKEWTQVSMMEFLKPVDVNEVLSAAKATADTPGVDAVMTDLIHALPNTVLQAIALLTTRVLNSEEEPPSTIKEAYIALIPKTSNEDELLEIENYRPIAVLSNLSYTDVYYQSQAY
jgi:hypothetical protein